MFVSHQSLYSVDRDQAQVSAVQCSAKVPLVRKS